jgi:hypothetical protein
VHLSGKDALAIMPTGGGKSICFQLPALLLSGITIVFSIDCSNERSGGQFESKRNTSLFYQ